MEERPFGQTGLTVSILGLGTGRLGREEVSERDAERLLHGAVDMGVTLIDTARGYGSAEERIGRHLSGRRSRVVLSTKVGYGISGIPDQTYDAVIAGVKEALQRMRTDVLDIVHLHSFPAETIRQNGLWDALQAMVSQGLVRVAGYSGENEDLTAAVDGGRVQAIECSVNVCDQRTIDDPLPRAKQKGYGVIAKRPLANAPWRHTTRPVGQYVEEYWHRWTTMHVDTPIPPDELFLRFAAYTWGVDSVVTGVSSLEHLQRNAQALEQGLLPRELYNDLRSRFRECDSGWRGQV